MSRSTLAPARGCQVLHCLVPYMSMASLNFYNPSVWFIISPRLVKPEGTIGLHSVRQSVCLSVCPSPRFPDFSLLCFHISGWKLVPSFYMKSYRSSSTFDTVDLLFHELLLPFVQNLFSGFFSAMLSHIWIKIGRMLPYEELQIKFDFRHK